MFLDEPMRLMEKGEAVQKEFLTAQANRMESGYEVTTAEAKLYTPKEIAAKMERYAGVAFSAF